MFELAFILLVLGLVLLGAGVVGRRMGDEPRCKGCGYDLSGLVAPGQEPTGRDAPGIHCPECGCDLKLTTTSPGDLGSPIRIGHRKRRRTAIALGIILLLPSVSLLGYAGAMLIAGPSWIHRKPVTILIYEARNLRGERADAAITELYKRLIETTTTPAQERAIISAALEVQALPDPGLWFGTPYRVLLGWGTLFDIAARQNGNATPEQARKYVQNALAIRFEHRSRARPGDDWPLGVVIDRTRVAGVERPLIRPVLEELSIGPWTLDTSTVVITGAANARNGERFIAAVVPLGEIPLGRHTVRQRWTVSAHEPGGPRAAPGAIMGSWTVEIESTVLVQPRGFETVDVYVDGQQQSDLREAMRASLVALRPGDPGSITVDVSLTRGSANMALRAIVEGDQGEWPIGHIYARDGQATTQYRLMADWPATLGAPRRLRLETNTDVARMTPSLERIVDLNITLDLGDGPLPQR